MPRQAGTLQGAAGRKSASVPITQPSRPFQGRAACCSVVGAVPGDHALHCSELTWYRP